MGERISVSSDLMVDPEQKYRNLSDVVEERLSRHPEHIAFDLPVRDATGAIECWKHVTTAEFHRQVRAVAAGLMAQGVGLGDRVAIFSPTVYEWAVADCALMYAGAQVVPIYDTSSPQQVGDILADAGVVAAFAGSQDHADTLARAAEERGLTVTVWCWENSGDYPCLADVEESGCGVEQAKVDQRRAQVGPADVATLVYTSGTSGVPKGVKISHRNMMGQVLNVAAAYSEIVHEQGRTVIFLPLAHVLARGLQLVCLVKGMRIAHLSNPKELISQLPHTQPTFLVVVPRVLEKIRDAVYKQAQAKHLGRVWQAAERTALAVARAQEQGVRPSRSLLFARAAYDVLFFHRVRSLLGGKIEWILSGGAPLAREVSLLFAGMRVPVVEGYGLTETTAPLAGNRPGAIRSGTVGVPLPGAEIRISEEGEVLARGIGVISGYTNSSLDSLAFTEDGYLRTGDLGSLDPDGYLTIRGRLKDEITTAGGKSVSPFTWENAVLTSPLVEHAVMVGDKRPYLVALIVPSEEGRALPQTALNRALHKLVEDANSLVAHSEQVRRFKVIELDERDPELVTPTQKLKRAALSERYAQVIEGLYSA